MSFRKRHKTGKVTRIILFVSFVILLGRLIYVVPAAFQHHQQKQAEPAAPASTINEK